ncbi:TlpA family protein disulfide reductase [Sphingobacterium tabacisoli]|uniref:TlpA family protein disulfide reductase n=1 Tax=Sphingobacterium tabacisoli TaxID=2044855 RepID=A0ABW5L2J9_9SPHI|nr:TlpA disulfide reductase family protein [Sphingobacterium tabacisoli]
MVGKLKIIGLLLGCLILVQEGFAQAKKYTITSSIKDFADTTYSLTIWNGTSNTVSKTGGVKKGQVFYEDTTSVPLVIRMTFPTERLYKRADRGYYPVKSQSVWLVATPGSKIHLKGHLSDFAEVYPSGDKENEAISRLNKVYHPLINKSVNMTMRLAKEQDDVAVLEQLKKEQEAVDQEAVLGMTDFLKNNASSIAGLYYMNDMLLRKVISVEMVDSLLPTIKKPYQETAFYHTLVQRIEGNKFAVGKSIFTIKSSNTYDGKRFDSEAWKGKFYLIDFWGSWCGPCMADVPALKKMRDAFPEQLEVLGIASDKEAGWRKAIEQHELNWTQILSATGDQDFVTRLNVTGFPTKILVDPQGNIVYRSTGGGETSFDSMSEIIKAYKK